MPNYYLINRKIMGNNLPYSLNRAAITDMSDANRTLVAAEYNCPLIEISGTTLTANRNIVMPLDDGAIWIVVNKCVASNFSLQFIGATGTGALVPSDGTGSAVWIYCDGTNFHLGGGTAIGAVSLTSGVTGTLPMTHGGTGVTAISGTGLVTTTSGAIDSTSHRIDLSSSTYIDQSTVLPTSCVNYTQVPAKLRFATTNTTTELGQAQASGAGSDLIIRSQAGGMGSAGGNVKFVNGLGTANGTFYWANETVAEGSSTNCLSMTVSGGPPVVNVNVEGSFPGMYFTCPNGPFRFSGGTVGATQMGLQVHHDGVTIGGTSTSFGTGSGVLLIANATTNVSSNPTSAYVVWAQSGALKGRGTSGTVTTIGNADPHCPKCGNDFAQEYQHPDTKKHMAACFLCMADAMKAAGVDTSWMFIRENC